MTLSIVLPPEMFYQFKGKKGKEELDVYKAYFKEEKEGKSDKDKEKWAKVKPRGASIVVKTFKLNDDGKPLDRPLPYELVPGSAAIDVWELGILIHHDIYYTS